MVWSEKVVLMKSSQTTAQIAYRAIKDMYVKRELRPGDQLVEAALAEELGISRTPVREAIRMLQQEGLVVSIKNRGSFIKDVTKESLLMNAETIEAVDGMIAYLVAEKIAENAVDSEMVSLLASYPARMDAALKNNDIKEWQELDRDFHQQLAVLAGNEPLLESFTSASEYMSQDLWILFPNRSNKTASNKDHFALMTAIAAGDKDKARSVAQKHRHRIREIIKNSI